ncbi:MAG: hypothetical protein ACTS6J_23345 [Burkholderiales bacterium]
MVMLETIKQRINQRVNRVLLIGQSSLSQSQYEAFRKLVLDEFGRSGLATELDRVWREQDKDR